jgi:hypothetical protein
MDMNFIKGKRGKGVVWVNEVGMTCYENSISSN